MQRVLPSALFGHFSHAAAFFSCSYYEHRSVSKICASPKFTFLTSCRAEGKPWGEKKLGATSLANHIAQIHTGIYSQLIFDIYLSLDRLFWGNVRMYPNVTFNWVQQNVNSVKIENQSNVSNQACSYWVDQWCLLTSLAVNLVFLILSHCTSNLLIANRKQDMTNVNKGVEIC